MDDIVKAALLKWPNVPDCRGWLALDARGQWYMRDDRIQAAGPFPQVKGSRIQHEPLLAFLHRNYESDGRGAWYFQNGPQRVYVELEAAPWVWRLQARPDPQAANNQPTKVAAGTCEQILRSCGGGGDERRRQPRCRCCCNRRSWRHPSPGANDGQPQRAPGRSISSHRPGQLGLEQPSALPGHHCG